MNLKTARLIKVARLSKRRRARPKLAPSVYKYQEDCVSLEYKVEANGGAYVEDWCSSEGGILLNGILAYVSEEPIVLGGTTFNGTRYIGTDESGSYNYFFGSEPMEDRYVVVCFVDGWEEENALFGVLAERS
jgi:hypothetical protein